MHKKRVNSHAKLHRHLTRLRVTDAMQRCTKLTRAFVKNVYPQIGHGYAHWLKRVSAMT